MFCIFLVLFIFSLIWGFILSEFLFLNLGWYKWESFPIFVLTEINFFFFRCLNWLGMQLEITRKIGLYQDTSSWLWEMMKSWASSWEWLPLPMVVCCLTFTRHFFPRNLEKTRGRLDLPLRSSKFIIFLFWVTSALLGLRGGLMVYGFCFGVLVASSKLLFVWCSLVMCMKQWW